MDTPNLLTINDEVLKGVWRRSGFSTFTEI